MGSTRLCSHASYKFHVLRYEACSFRAWRFSCWKAPIYVMQVPYFFLLFVPFNFLMFVFLCQDRVYFWPKANTPNYWRYDHISRLSSSQSVFVCGALKRMIFGIITCVVQIHFVYSSISVYTSSVWISNKRLPVSLYMSSHFAPYCFHTSGFYYFQVSPSRA